MSSYRELFSPIRIKALSAQMDQLIKRNAYTKGAVEMACVDLATMAGGSLQMRCSAGASVRCVVPVNIVTLRALSNGPPKKESTWS